MQFLIVAYDGLGMLEKRLAVRDKHLDNMTRMKEHVICAGGILDENGKMAGYKGRTAECGYRKRRKDRKVK